MTMHKLSLNSLHSRDIKWLLWVATVGDAIAEIMLIALLSSYYQHQSIIKGGPYLWSDYLNLMSKAGVSGRV